MDLFLYGVLMRGAAAWPFLAGLGAGRAARTYGALFAIPDPQGWYPALLPGNDVVHGLLHDAGRVDLAAVDAFEGAEYRRGSVMVEVAGQTVAAQAYLWQGVLPGGAQQIAHGDFARWLAETGRAPFGSA